MRRLRMMSGMAIRWMWAMVAGGALCFHGLGAADVKWGLPAAGCWLLAQTGSDESYTVRQGFPRDGSRFEVYDRSGRRTATIQERSSGIVDRWEIRDANGRRIGEARGYGSSIAPRWDIYDASGRRTGTVRESGSSISPRWDVYDDKGRRTGTVRPAPLETEYFRGRRDADRPVPPVPFVPGTPSGPPTSSRPGWVTAPVPPPDRRYPVPGPWIQPPAVPGGGVSGLAAPPGRMPTPPIPPIPPVPPVPPVSGGQPQPPASAGPIISPPGTGYGYPYAIPGYGQGNSYYGYSQGNAYEGYSHGGVYAVPPPPSR